MLIEINFAYKTGSYEIDIPDGTDKKFLHKDVKEIMQNIDSYEGLPDPMDYLSGKLVDLPVGKEDDLEFKTRLALKMAAALAKLKDIYAKHYNDDHLIGFPAPLYLSDQPKEFQIAVESFAGYCNKYLSNETTAWVGMLLNNIYRVTSHYFKGGNSSVIDQYIQQSLDFLYGFYKELKDANHAS